MGDVIDFASRKRVGANAVVLAEDAYREGCDLEDKNEWEAAKNAYRRSLAHNPRHACSLCNLATIEFNRGSDSEAERLYRLAIEFDPELAEAHYNLGFLVSERGDWLNAIECFKASIAADPDFADGHFNLAMSLTETCQYRAAQPHWTRFLELRPAGRWSEEARRHQRFAKKHMLR